MMNKKLYISTFCLLASSLWMLEACSPSNDSVATEETNPITIGGSTMSRTVTSVDATTVDWLKSVLTSTGIDIKYGIRDGANAFKNVPAPVTATLKYDNTKSVYTLTNTATNKDALWLDNGKHLFQSVYYPSALSSSTHYSIDQSSSTVYDNLSHYIFIPGDHSIVATVDKVTIPYQHRLARVIFNILLDSDLKTFIKGYNSSTGGGSSCSFRITNINVLGNVNETGNHPVWELAAEVIPHFLKGTDNITYQGVNFTNVPQFDFLIRPTGVYYDETDPSAALNKLTFTVTLTLDNGLEYSKDCEVKLEPNQQVQTYLHVSREHVDFNQSGLSNWSVLSADLDYFGMDNGNLTLSDAGGSWQRAYRVGTSNLNIIDGTKYDGTEYIATAADFIEALKTAKAGGLHHGDYFILTSDLVLPSDWAAFEFTGHLDGRGHTISFADGAAHTLFTNLNGSYDITTIGEANVHSEKGIEVPVKGYRAEILNVTMANKSSLISGSCSGYLFNNVVTAPGTLYGTLDSTYGLVVNCQTK